MRSLPSGIISGAHLCLRARLTIGVRAVTRTGTRLALVGIVTSAAAILTVTMLASTFPRLQGILLTGEAIGVFIVAMILFPRLKFAPAELRRACRVLHRRPRPRDGRPGEMAAAYGFAGRGRI